MGLGPSKVLDLIRLDLLLEWSSKILRHHPWRSHCLGQRNFQALQKNTIHLHGMNFTTLWKCLMIRSLYTLLELKGMFSSASMEQVIQPKVLQLLLKSWKDRNLTLQLYLLTSEDTVATTAMMKLWCLNKSWLKRQSQSSNMLLRNTQASPSSLLVILWEDQSLQKHMIIAKIITQTNHGLYISKVFS